TLSTLIRPEEMRGLIDRSAISGMEAVLQRMAERSRPRNPDELADALAHLGDLSAAELRDRAGPDWRTMIETLVVGSRPGAWRSPASIDGSPRSTRSTTTGCTRPTGSETSCDGTWPARGR